ncbi:DUF3667 domain-containing protein [Hymenobacter sp. 102]|uniref:DUF3667 domain-containing protein n=1 Tax=Hymenobacter sp. 102 TaxID=3403152 RepID=UPI003CF4DE93
MIATLTPSTSATAEAAHHAAECLNCGHPVPDRFCGRCGQDAHHTHRLNMAHMLHDIPHSVWHVDKGILYSLRTIITRPGTTIRAYLAGQRVDHFRPLSLLLVVTGTFAFISSLLHIEMFPPRDPSVDEAVYQSQKAIAEFMAKYMSWVYVALVPVIAGFARLFLRRGGYNYAECLVIAAFITAVCNALTLFSLPLAYFYSGTPQIQQFSLGVSVVSFGYATWAYSSLLAHTGLSLPKRLIRGFFPFFLGIMIPSILGGILMVALQWDTLKANIKQQQRTQQQQVTAAPRPTVPPGQH